MAANDDRIWPARWVEGDPAIPVLPVISHQFNVTEKTGVLYSAESFGSHVELDTNAILNAGNQPTLKSFGHYPYFRYRSTKSLGDGKVFIRGRLKQLDGSRDVSPTDLEFDVSSAVDGEVFVADTRMADNCSLMVSSSGGFDGSVDYGIVSPWNAGGMLRTLWGFEFDFVPVAPQIIENWLAAVQIQGFQAGVGGGAFDIVPERLFRSTDTIKNAAPGQLGHDHHKNLRVTFSGANEGLILSLAARNVVGHAMLYTS